MDESQGAEDFVCEIWSGCGREWQQKRRFKSRSETVGLLEQLSCLNGILLMLSSKLGANNIYSNFIIRVLASATGCY